MLDVLFDANDADTNSVVELDIVSVIFCWKQKVHEKCSLATLIHGHWWPLKKGFGL